VGHQDDIVLEVMHKDDASQNFHTKIKNDMLVIDLKEKICKRAKRGVPDDVVLWTSFGTLLSDEVVLSSIEDDLDTGVLVSGIRLSGSEEVYVRIVHAASDTQQAISVTVQDTASILDVRKAILAQLGEKSLSSCKLVKAIKNGTSFSSLDNDEALNGRTELLFLGCPLPEAITVRLNVDRGGRQSHFEKKIDSGSSVKQFTAALAKEFDCKPNAIDLRCLGGGRAMPLEEKIEASNAFAVRILEDSQTFDAKEQGEDEKSDKEASAEELVEEPAARRSRTKKVAGKIARKTTAAPVAVETLQDVKEERTVKVMHANSGNILQVTLPGAGTIGELRRAVMAALRETRLSQVKIAAPDMVKDGVLTALPDNEQLGGRALFVLMGQDADALPTSPVSPQHERLPVSGLSAWAAAARGEATQQEEEPSFLLMGEEAEEFQVSVFIDRSLDMKMDVTLKGGTTVRMLKEQIANEDATGMTQAEQINFRLPGGFGTLDDSDIIPAAVTELDLVV